MLPFQNPTSRTTNQNRFHQRPDTSSLAQYHHIPMNRNNNPSVPKTPTNAIGSRIQNDILAGSTLLRRRSSTQTVRIEDIANRVA